MEEERKKEEEKKLQEHYDINKRSRIFVKHFLKNFRSFRRISWKKIDFGHRSGAVARPGSRELLAIKIPASCDAWRPPKRQKNDSEKKLFFWVSEISFSSFFLDFGRATQF